MDATQHRRIQRRSASNATQVIVAIIAGQSNAEGGRALTANRDAGDTDVTNAYQFVGWSGAINYRTISSDITPLLHYNGWTDLASPPTYLGSGEYLARQLLTDNPAAKVVLVPTAKGSTPMAQPGDAWYPHATSGGVLFENMIAQADLARTGALAMFPGAQIQFQFYWVQGEHESGNSISRAAYLGSLTNFISYARSRINGAANAKFVIGSMIPRLWAIGSPQYSASYAAINAAHVDASVDIAGTYYVRGPAGSADGLHYSPQDQLRVFGLSWGAALSDVTGPAMTNAATFSNLASSTLSLALTCNDSHATFHINGGAGAANFEISDRYLSPLLRWTGNGSGPAAGSYAVGLRARDGSGNFGATQTVTITVTSEVSPTTFFTASERGMVWDLSNTANLFQNIAGTTPVSAAGQAVGKVLDLSGNGNHWVAAADNSTRPTYQIDSDGKAYLSFDGSNDALIAGTPFINPANYRFSTCVGVYGGAQGSYGGIIDSASHIAAYPVIDAPLFNSAELWIYGDDDVAGGTASPAKLTTALDSTKRAVTTGWNGLGGNWRIRNAASRPSGGSSGSYQISTDGGSGRTFANLTRSVMGARGHDGNSSFPSRFFNGRIYSGFAIGRFLTDAEVKSGENWVASRTLAGALP